MFYKKHDRFSLRKLTIGLASVFLGSLLFTTVTGQSTKADSLNDGSNAVGAKIEEVQKSNASAQTADDKVAAAEKQSTPASSDSKASDANAQKESAAPEIEKKVASPDVSKDSASDKSASPVASDAKDQKAPAALASDNKQSAVKDSKSAEASVPASKAPVASANKDNANQKNDAAKADQKTPEQTNELNLKNAKPAINANELADSKVKSSDPKADSQVTFGFVDNTGKTLVADKTVRGQNGTDIDDMQNYSKQDASGTYVDKQGLMPIIHNLTLAANGTYTLMSITNGQGVTVKKFDPSQDEPFDPTILGNFDKNIDKEFVFHFENLSAAGDSAPMHRRIILEDEQGNPISALNTDTHKMINGSQVDSGHMGAGSFRDRSGYNSYVIWENNHYDWLTVADKPGYIIKDVQVSGIVPGGGEFAKEADGSPTTQPYEYIDNGKSVAINQYHYEKLVPDIIYKIIFAKDPLTLDLNGNGKKTYDGKPAVVDLNNLKNGFKLTNNPKDSISLNDVKNNLTLKDFDWYDNTGKDLGNLTNTSIDPVNVGSYTIAVNKDGLTQLKKDNPNLDIAGLNGKYNYVINPAVISGTFSGNNSKTYDGNPVTTVQVNSNGDIKVTYSYPANGGKSAKGTYTLKDGDYEWNTSDHKAPTNAGNYTITLTKQGQKDIQDAANKVAGNGNVIFTDKDGKNTITGSASFDIKPAVVTVTINGKGGKTYDGKPVAPIVSGKTGTITVTYTYPKNGKDTTVTYTLQPGDYSWDTPDGKAPKDAGHYTIGLTTQGETNIEKQIQKAVGNSSNVTYYDNHNNPTIGGKATYDITPGVATVTVNGGNTKTYDGNPATTTGVTVTYTYPSNGNPTGGTGTYTLKPGDYVWNTPDGKAPKDVGSSYTITLTPQGQKDIETSVEKSTGNKGNNNNVVFTNNGKTTITVKPHFEITPGTATITLGGRNSKTYDGQPVTTVQVDQGGHIIVNFTYPADGKTKSGHYVLKNGDYRWNTTNGSAPSQVGNYTLVLTPQGQKNIEKAIDTAIGHAGDVEYTNKGKSTIGGTAEFDITPAPVQPTTPSGNNSNPSSTPSTTPVTPTPTPEPSAPTAPQPTTPQSSNVVPHGEQQPTSPRQPRQPSNVRLHAEKTPTGKHRASNVRPHSEKQPTSSKRRTSNVRPHSEKQPARHASRISNVAPHGENAKAVKTTRNVAPHAQTNPKSIKTNKAAAPSELKNAMVKPSAQNNNKHNLASMSNKVESNGNTAAENKNGLPQTGENQKAGFATALAGGITALFGMLSLAGTRRKRRN